jgi:hypothetical protein
MRPWNVNFRLLSALAKRTALPVVCLLFGGAAVTDAQSLRGSPAKVNRMYSLAIAGDFGFVKTTKGLNAAVKDGALVKLGSNRYVDLDGVTYPYALPKTRDFVYSFAVKYHAACGERLVVTSAARPENKQPSNASRWSVHPTGMAVDLRHPSGKCLTFTRNELLALQAQGLIDATEERHPAHFHVAVVQTPAARPRQALP